MWDLLGIPEQDSHSRAKGVEGELSLSPQWAPMYRFDQVRLAAIVKEQPGYCSLWKAEFRHGFVLKRRLRGWRVEGDKSI